MIAAHFREGKLAKASGRGQEPKMATANPHCSLSDPKIQACNHHPFSIWREPLPNQMREQQT